ncbi:MAG: hypothetical protein AAF251_15300 [Pseudomonadota bacterium]
MEDPILTFVDFYRRGLANLARPSASEPRASFGVQVKASASGLGPTSTRTEQQTVSLQGAADVIGLSRGLIARREPPPNITDFEPNQLAFVEFYEPDLPWRFSPDASDAPLQPWLTLLVLKEEEFTITPGASPLPRLSISAGSAPLPDLGQRRFFAHIQLQRTDHIAAALAADQAGATSRVISQRALEPQTRYTAFLVPALAVGALAGLGETVAGFAVSATAPAWTDTNAGVELPVYDHWFFMTGPAEDFESLARRFKPFAAPPEIGFQPGDFSEPGYELPGPQLPEGETLAVGGAIQSPVGEPLNWPAAGPDPFRQGLVPIINVGAGGDEQPVLSPPLYGRWHALQDNGDPANRTDWFHTLNFDPRLRIAAGLGAEVVRRNQERLMAEAWRQLGDVLKANQIIGAGAVSWLSSRRFYRRRVLPRDRASQFAFIAPSAHRIVTGDPSAPQEQTAGETLRTRAGRNGRRPSGSEPAIRKAFRPSGRLARRFGSTDSSQASYDVATGDLAQVPPRTNLSGPMVVENQISPPEGGGLNEPSLPSANPGRTPPKWTQTRWFHWLLVALVVLILALLLLASVAGPLAGGLAGGLLVVVLFLLWLRGTRQSEDPNLADVTGWLDPGLFDNAPGREDFAVGPPAAPVSDTPPSGGGDPADPDSGESGAAVADAFINAHEQWAGNASDAPQAIPVDPVDSATLDALIDEAVAKIDPAITIPRRVATRVDVSVTIWTLNQRAALAPIRAHPVFEDITSSLLADLAPNRLVPNIDKMPRNSVSVFASNARFIEAYFVGLNHEMSRELLWRGYPTDQRGSYFRRFWARPFSEEGSANDIEYLHRWQPDSALGTHGLDGLRSDQAIVAIRGDLLKKYPQTLIYLQKARYDGTGADRTKRLDDSDPDAVLTPIFSTQILPDMSFFGFDVSVDDLRGDDQDAGYFAVFAERPGETRFGLDFATTPPTPFENWADLDWDKAASQVVNEHLVLPSDPAAIRPVVPSGTPADDPRRLYSFATLNSDGGPGLSADIASVLMQDPFLMAMHAEHLIKTEPAS